MALQIRQPLGGRTGRAVTVLTLVLALSLAGGVYAQDAEAEPSGPRAASVQGTSRLVGQVQSGTTLLDGGVLMTRQSILLTVEEATDPRVVGEARITLNIDAYRDASGGPYRPCRSDMAACGSSTLMAPGRDASPGA